VVDTTTHHVPLKLAQLAAPTPLTGRTSNKRDTLFSSEDVQEKGLKISAKSGAYISVKYFSFPIFLNTATERP